MTTNKHITTGWIRSFAVWHYSPEVEARFEVARHLCTGRLLQYEERQGPVADFAALADHTWQANLCTECLRLMTGARIGEKQSA